MRGSKNKDLLKIAFKEKRIVVTLDKDFCNLIFKDLMPCQGIILLRLSDESQKNIICVLENVLENIGGGLENNFTVADDRNIRIRKIK